MAINFKEDEVDDGDVVPNMNTTPLIDVLLVLLVMLIITIPIRLHTVSIDLPGGLPPPDAPMPLVVRLDISATNAMLWNGEPVADRLELESMLQAASFQSPAPEIHVYADPKSKYDAVAAALTAAQRQGLQKIGVVGLEAYAKPAL